MSDRSWRHHAGVLLRAVIVALVAVLASGVVHAHPDEEAACEDAEDDGDCPEEWCGPAHHCGCCSPLVVTCADAAKIVPASARRMVPSRAGPALVSSGVRTRVERPPRV